MDTTNIILIVLTLFFVVILFVLVCRKRRSVFGGISKEAWTAAKRKDSSVWVYWTKNAEFPTSVKPYGEFNPESVEVRNAGVGNSGEIRSFSPRELFSSRNQAMDVHERELARKKLSAHNFEDKKTGLSKLMGKVKELEEQNAILKGKLESVEQELSTSSSKNEEEKEKLRMTIENLNEQITELKERINEVRELHASKVLENSNLEKEIKETRAVQQDEMDKLKLDNQNLNSVITQLEDAKAKVRQDAMYKDTKLREQLNVEKQKHNEEVDELTKELKLLRPQLTAEISEGAQNIKNANLVRNRLEEKLQNSETQNRVFEREIETHEEKLRLAMKSVEQAKEAEIEASREKQKLINRQRDVEDKEARINKELYENISLLADTKNQATEQAKKHKAELREKIEMLERQKRDIEAKEKDIKDKDTAIDKQRIYYEGKIAEHKREADMKQANIEGLRKQVQDKDIQQDEIKHQLNASKLKESSLEENQNRLIKELEASQGLNEKQRAEITRYEESSKAFEHEVDRLHDQAVENETKYTEEIKGITQELTNVKGINEDQQLEIEKLKQNEKQQATYISTLEESFKNVKNDLDESRTRIVRLDESLNTTKIRLDDIERQHVEAIRSLADEKRQHGETKEGLKKKKIEHTSCQEEVNKLEMKNKQLENQVRMYLPTPLSSCAVECDKNNMYRRKISNITRNPYKNLLTRETVQADIDQLKECSTAGITISRR